MANTRMSAKNGFHEGLIMDFSPTSSSANSLSNALNATLITYNGNEMSLLNDMGNGRVETAFLPEGYIPVGTCEFGDIIYIVSYNPILDESQIGCFPSPERNISSDELYYAGETGYTNLNNSEFLEDNGKLKNTTVKKVLIDSKKLNPGDKYIIYTDNGKLPNNWNDYLNVRVVSIEDTGKITELKSTSRYFPIRELSQTETNKPDIDSYRDLLLSGWSIFSSKVSGKLAILAELKTIDTFTCSYSLEYTNSKTYNIEIFPEFTKTDSQNPYIILDKIGFQGDTTASFTSSITNNLWYRLELETGEKITIANVKLDNATNIPLFEIVITPAMSFGRLENQTVTIIIDFNKVGTGEVSLTGWKYYNTDDSEILFGLDVYPKPNWSVKYVSLKFYDFLGLVGEYVIDDKLSYSGTHIQRIGFNGKSSNYKLTRTERTNEGTKIIKHPGIEVPENEIIEDYDYSNDDNYVYYKNKLYNNDAGIIYSGFLYLVAINVVLSHNKILDETITTIYRWYWTNSMFNEYFYQSKDFYELNFELILNGEALFKTNNFLWKYKEINNLAVPFKEGENYKTYSANVQYIGDTDENNINMYIKAGLLNDYGCFNLNKDNLNTITVSLYSGLSRISYNVPSLLYKFSDKETTITDMLYLNVTPQQNKLQEDINFIFPLLNDSKIENESDNIKDSFDIYFSNSTEKGRIDIDEDNVEDEVYCKNITLDKCYYLDDYNNNYIPLTMKSIIYNKAYTQDIYNNSTAVPVYIPLINNREDLNNLGIDIVSDTLKFTSGMCLSLRGTLFSGTSFVTEGSTLNFTGALDDDYNIKFSNDNRIIDVRNDNELINQVLSTFVPKLKLFFPVYLGGHGGDSPTKRYDAINNSVNSYPNIRNWQVEKGAPTVSTSSLTNGVFDITSNRKFNNIKDATSVSFLGMKYNDGLAIFNSAFIDSNSGGNVFLQKDIKTNSNSSEYDIYNNFAYLLYLILSNTYHRDRKSEDALVEIKNYVRNDNYEINFEKEFIFSLKENPELTKHDILITHNNLLERFTLSSLIKGFKEINALNGIDWSQEYLTKNITLKLLEYGKKHTLKMTTKNSPMTFLDSDVVAYYMRNGINYPSKLLSNNFYIYLNGELQLYANKSFKFPITEVNNNIKYITNNTVYSLSGIKLKLSYVKTSYDDAYNYYLELVWDYLMRNNFYRSSLLLYYNYVQEERLIYVDNMFDTFTESSIYGYSKDRIKYDMIDVLFPINLIGSQYLCTFITQNYSDLIENYLRKGNIQQSNYYEIDTKFNLNNFMYQGELILNPAVSLNTFGVKDANSSNSAYGGFIKDIVIDTNYLVI